MSTSVQRFRRIQNARRKAQARREAAAPVCAKRHESSPIEHGEGDYDGLAGFERRWQETWDTAAAPVTVTIEEVEDLLRSVHASWDKVKLECMLEQCQQQVISSIVGPFGIGTLIAAYDKTGGNVDTLHNVEKGVYATESERQRFENRGAYDSTAYHSDPAYIAKNRELSRLKKEQGVKDAYTGRILHKHDSTDLDHVVSANEIHNDPRRILAEMNGPELANADTNLAITTSTVNRSKKAKAMEEFIAQQKQHREAREKRIDALVAQEKLSDSERKELEKLKTFQSLDEELMRKADETARNDITGKLNWAYYTSTKFAKNVAVTSGIEAGKMGLQQALGLLLTDFFSALFAEIRDAYDNGFREGVDASGFFDALAARCRRVAVRVIADWRNVVTAFRDGAISGFLSNALTAAINAFATTAKNIVRMIREGVFSLLRALKLLLFRPEGMTLREAADAALKLIATGVLTVGGIALDEYIKAALMPLMGGIPAAPALISIVSGGLTGVATTLVIYAIDRMDPFGVRAEERHAYVLESITKARDESRREFDATFMTVAWAISIPE